MLTRMQPFPIALEITPPSRPKPEILLRRARGLGPLPACINVIQRPDRQSSLAASIQLRGDGFEPVWHLANRGRSASGIEADIALARRAGLSRVLCVRGDHKGEDEPDTPAIREVVRMLRHGLPGARVGVTLNQHADPDRALRNLWPKLEAGAQSIQTQLSFDLDALAPLARELKRQRPDLTIAPMLIPVLSPAAALQLSRRLSIPVPAQLIGDLVRFGPRAGWDHFARLAASIRADPLYDGIALMTPIDMEPRFAARLRKLLR